MNNFKKLVIGIYGLSLIGCSSFEKDSDAHSLIYKSNKFTIYKDSIVQNVNKTNVISPTHLSSNYNSPINENYSNLLAFKFSINEKDNDVKQGVDRLILITDQTESIVYDFGKEEEFDSTVKTSILPVDYKFTFKVNMNPVFEQFKEKGYYLASDGSKIAKSDFKNVYIAGGALPLTWDFSNLDERGLKMNDENQDGVYEITLILNPKIKKEEKQWYLKEDITSKPTYSSNQPIVDALYNMSLEEGKLAIEPDSTFRTGAKWAGVWTRDISYSIILAFGYLEPEIAINSLMQKVNRGRIIQDTGSGGAWPVSSDRTTWALAAWEVYKITGDINWLKKAYQIIKNTVDDDYKVILNKSTSLFSGESSFLDWREQTYPKWMSNMDIYVSQNLGTNVIHYQTHVILTKMGKILGEPTEKYDEIAANIKNGINNQLWLEDRGYYAQYLYGRHYLIPSNKFEALGEALAILYNVASEEQSKSIIENSPLTEFGVTCIYPQIPNIPPYHNNGIWPFVQSYWNLAAAKVGNEKVLSHGLASIYRASGLFLSNYENMVAETGDFRGTEINSHRMLWSMAGNLSMVYKVFMGIEFDENQLRIQPVIPKEYGGAKNLKNFKYRNAILDIQVNGYGNIIKKIELDGKQLKEPIIPSSLKGEHTIVVTMKNNNFSIGKINLVENKFTLESPVITKSNDQIIWEPIVGAKLYNIYENGKLIETTIHTFFKFTQGQFKEYSVSALDSNGFESFTCEPVVISNTPPLNFELENFIPKATKDYVNYSGNGFVEISNNKNTTISFIINISDEGDYYLDFKYSNGSGPWNTDNKCAIRSLSINNNYIGTVVFPQRGQDEWSDWGYSNSYKVHLKKGENNIKLSFEDWNINMNVEVNKAMLDFLRVSKIN